MNTLPSLHRPDPSPAPVLVVSRAEAPAREEPGRFPQAAVSTWSPAPHPFYQAVVKRAFDAIAASVALLLLLPLLLIIALAIRLDSPGPVIYRQQRMGKCGRPFTMYKFRTMTWDPARNVVFFIEPDGTIVHKPHHDPRVTHLGRWLRHTSIDELPQLLNIIRGDMSLIGPRPEMVEIVRKYEPWQHRRHVVRPGLTGWWQVCGRDDCPMEENTDLDLYYVDHLSPGLDLEILLRTVAIVVTGRGAF